jgi:P-type Ca2+ transporter type 2C
MVEAIRMGRRIYDNLRKSIRYIISIHLPMIVVVLVPLLLGWLYPHILLPLHIIFLELVMGPTAAIAFENEPEEPNLMLKPPRMGNTSLFSWKELANLFLALANRSFDYAIHRTLFYKNAAFLLILGLSVLLLLAILYVPFLGHLFSMTALPVTDLGFCVLAGLLSVVWFEVFKGVKEMNTPQI